MEGQHGGGPFQASIRIPHQISGEKNLNAAKAQLKGRRLMLRQNHWEISVEVDEPDPLEDIHQEIVV
jgi:hypothetical protein